MGDDELAEATDRAFITPGYLPMQISTLLVKSATATILIDTGSAGAFGPTNGKLIENLTRAGVTPDDVTHVVLSHAHPDHAGGLLTADGAPQFAKAKVILSEAEHAFWTGPTPKMNGTLLPAEVQQGMIAGAQKVLAGVKGQIELKKPGDVVAGVVTLLDAAGHTPGHVALRISSGDDALLYIGDSIIAAGLQMPHPDWHILYDADPVMASQTRKRLLEEAASQRLLVSGSHLPFPGLGHVARDGKAYRWSPRAWEW